MTIAHRHQGIESNNVYSAPNPTIMNLLISTLSISIKIAGSFIAIDVLPKAIVAFQEMDRTYVVHIMLTLLYDDYLKLRGQLNTYLTTIGQTFEKAYNAQDDNQR